jgi:hypothetical protein
MCLSPLYFPPCRYKLTRIHSFLTLYHKTKSLTGLFKITHKSSELRDIRPRTDRDPILVRSNFADYVLFVGTSSIGASVSFHPTKKQGQLLKLSVVFSKTEEWQLLVLMIFFWIHIKTLPGKLEIKSYLLGIKLILLNFNDSPPSSTIKKNVWRLTSVPSTLRGKVLRRTYNLELSLQLLNTRQRQNDYTPKSF